MSRKKLIALVSAGVVLVVVVFIGVAQWQGWINIGADEFNIATTGNDGVPLDTPGSIGDQIECVGVKVSGLTAPAKETTTYDTDGDMVADCIESVLQDGTHIVSRDTDGDGTYDRWEQDKNGDGKIDVISRTDTNNNNNTTLILDEDGNGSIDTIKVFTEDNTSTVEMNDTNGDGISDSTTTTIEPADMGDNDSDGMLNSVDKCPDIAINSTNDANFDGCPDETPTPAEPTGAGTDVINNENPSPAEPLNDGL